MSALQGKKSKKEKKKKEEKCLSQQQKDLPRDTPDTVYEIFTLSSGLKISQIAMQSTLTLILKIQNFQ